MSEKSNTKRKLRVLHCPTLVGGNPYGLSMAERRHGVDSYCISLEQNYFKYKADEILTKESVSYLGVEIKRWQLLYRAIRDYDIIHFNYGSSISPKIPTYGHIKKKTHKLTYFLYKPYAWLLELKDLPLLKRAGKGIVVTYQGNDARQGDYCKKHFEINFANEVGSSYYNDSIDKLTRRRIKKFAKYADRIYSLNPDLLYVLPRQAEFIPYASVNYREIKIPEKKNRELLMVVHASTNRDVKGTKYIINAINKLKNNGEKIDFILVENMTNDEAMSIYKNSDIVIDQLLAGWYGGFAVEAMAMGKPVIAYIREEDLVFIPDNMKRDMPVINANPDTIYSVLKRLLSINKDELTNIGKKSREYVEKWHDPQKIAQKIIKDYQEIIKK